MVRDLYNAGVQIISSGNWGALQSGLGQDTNGYSTEPLINVLAMSNVLAPDEQLQLIMPQGSYYRLEPVIPYDESKLDGTDTQDLLTTAENYIAKGAGYDIYQAVLTALGGS